MKKVLIIILVLLSSSFINATEENAIKKVVNKWNELHNTRNTIEFKELYAPNVLFYGKYNSGEKCYRKKTAFLTSDFYQEIISPVTLTYYSSGIIKCSFTKRVTFKSIVKEHICYLLIEKKDNRYMITGESDVITDQNLRVKLNLGEQLDFKTKSTTAPYAVMFLAIISAGAIGYKLKKRNKKEEIIITGLSEETKSESLIQAPLREMQTVIIDKNVVEKVKIAVLDEIKGSISEVSSEKKKGDDFENYIVTLFNPKAQRFLLKEWRSDKIADNGIYALSSHNPDLEFQFIDGSRSYSFAVECKWRSKFQHREIDWAKPYQIQNYISYQEKNNIPVFIAIGVGGKPSEPEQLFVAPLN
jgi:hypothetical protein